jgi:hypothetical protein
VENSISRSEVRHAEVRAVKEKRTPTPEQLEALRDFAQRRGRYWKQELCYHWLAGTDASLPNGHLLRQVRNQLGPSWLGTFKL